MKKRTGHNSADAHYHTENEKGDYEYFQKGLQNRSPGKPSKDNTQTIINDSNNRKTIK